MNPAVWADDLTFAYPNGAELFAGLHLSIPAGSLFTVTGRSGVGKSTLLYCLGGVLPVRGQVKLMGSDQPSSPSARARWRSEFCSYVFQRGELLPELTILENVALPLRLAGKRRSDAMEAALQALAQLGVSDCADRRTDSISGGQAQRASVARALIRQPPIIFADEPTASLDDVSRTYVLSALQEAASGGATVVCATHDPVLVETSTQQFNLELAGAGQRVVS